MLLVYCCSVTTSGLTLWSPMNCSLPDFPVFHYLREFAQTHVPVSQWCHPTISSTVVPFPLAFNLSQHQGLFQWISVLHHVAKVLKLQLQQQSFNEYKRLISFRIDWFHLCAVQVKSLLQHHSLKASILQCSDFFMVQLSHLYMTTGKKKKHSFDYMDLCWQSGMSAFNSCLGLS